MSEVMFLYVTAPDERTAAHLGEALVEARLAACVNLIPGMRSIYRWEGKIESASEVIVIVKTSAASAQAARDLVRRLHPYEIPCIVALAATAEASNTDYLRWIASETRREPA